MKADLITNYVKSLNELLSSGFTLCISKSTISDNVIDIETEIFDKLVKTNLVKFKSINYHTDSSKDDFTNYFFWFENKEDFLKAIEISNVNLAQLGDGYYPLEVSYDKVFPIKYIY